MLFFFYNFLYAWQDWIKHLFCLFNTGTGTRNPWISDTGIIIIIIFFLKFRNILISTTFHQRTRTGTECILAYSVADPGNFYPGSGSDNFLIPDLDPDPNIFSSRIPDPGGIKAPDSGSATLLV
jgi:hypothetical protein